VKRLFVFLALAAAAWTGAYALEDPRMFFGKAPSPSPGVSERPAVEATLSALDAAMARFFEAGDERPARAVLAAPDDGASPLHEWYQAKAAQAQGTATTLVERRVRQVTLVGLDALEAVADETWETRAGGQATRATLSVSYVLVRAPAGLRVARVTAEPR
jgi:hypothetical protein